MTTTTTDTLATTAGALPQILRMSMLADSLRDTSRDMLTSGGWDRTVIKRMADRYRLLHAQAIQLLPSPDRDEVVVWAPALDEDAASITIESIFEAASSLAAYVDIVMSGPARVASMQMLEKQVEAAGHALGAAPAPGSSPGTPGRPGQYL